MIAAQYGLVAQESGRPRTTKNSMSLLAGRSFETCGKLGQLGNFAGAFLLSVAHVLKRDGVASWNSQLDF
jgi:hypothetical protein